MGPPLFIFLLCISQPAAAQTQQHPLSPWTADPITLAVFEAAVAFLVAIFVVTFILGSRHNLNIARSVATHLSSALQGQFATTHDDNGKRLTRDGMSYFWFHASGRRYTTGLTALLDLAKRMDVFSYTSSFMARPHEDRVIFYLPVAHDVAMPPISLFIVKKRELTRLKTLEDGKIFSSVQRLAADVVEVDSLPHDFVTMTEHPDVVTTLLPQSVRSLITENHRYFCSLHVTDTSTKWDLQSAQHPRLVRLEFHLPSLSSEHENVLNAMSTIALTVIDNVAEAKIPAAALKKSMEIRKNIALDAERRLQKQRAEEAAERRAEKKKAEEEAVGKMSAEKQRKYEEKKRKKEYSARIRKASKK